MQRTAIPALVIFVALALAALPATPGHSITSGSETSIVQQSTTGTSTTFDSELLSSLPNSGRVVDVFAQGAPGVREVYARTSNDNGRTWDPAVNISGAINTADSYSIDGVSTSSGYYIAYTQAAGDEFQIMTSKSADGETWTQPQSLTDGRGGNSPTIAAREISGEPDRIAVTWFTGLGTGTGDAVLRESLDGGENFEFHTDLEVGTAKGASVTATQDSFVAATWNASGLKINTYLTPVFGSTPEVTEYDTFLTDGLFLRSAPNNRVFFAGAGITDTRFGVVLGASTDGGRHWRDLIEVNNVGLGVGISGVRAAASANDIYAAWNQQTVAPAGIPQVNYAWYNIPNQTITPVITLSDPTKESLFPDVAVKGNTPYVTWTELMPPVFSKAKAYIGTGVSTNTISMQSVPNPGPIRISSFGSDDDINQQSTEPERDPYFYLSFIKPDNLGDPQLNFMLAYITGDANCDAHVTGADVLAALFEQADIDSEAECLPALDVDCDGARTFADLEHILQHLAGVDDPTPDCSPIDY